jgi:hypothetical protein
VKNTLAQLFESVALTPSIHRSLHLLQTSTPIIPYPVSSIACLSTSRNSSYRIGVKRNLVVVGLGELLELVVQGTEEFKRAQFM